MDGFTIPKSVSSSIEGGSCSTTGLDLMPNVVIASMGRSGSTTIANWLNRPALDEYLFVEPELFAWPWPYFVLRQFEPLGLQARLGLPDDVRRIPDARREEACAVLSRLLEGVRYGVKEIDCFYLPDSLAGNRRPEAVLLTVRNLADVYLSYKEKFARSGVGDDEGWTEGYIQRRSERLLEIHREAEACGVPLRVLRYEDFVASPTERKACADFLGFRGGGALDRNMQYYGGKKGRLWESGIRHGKLAGRSTRPANLVGDADRRKAAEIAESFDDYQKLFGYA